MICAGDWIPRHTRHRTNDASSVIGVSTGAQFSVKVSPRKQVFFLHKTGTFSAHKFLLFGDNEYCEVDAKGQNTDLDSN